MKTRLTSPRRPPARPARSTLAQCIAVIGLASAAASAAAQTTVLPEIQVTAAGIPDYEFDSARNGVYCPTCNFGDGNNRFAFSDPSNKLWVGHIDFNTGAFYPPDGHGALVDSGVAAATTYGNGPEWMCSTAGSQLVYTKYQNGVVGDATAGIALASMVAGAWTPGFFPGADSIPKSSPAATLDCNDTAPRINYVNPAKTGIWWRSLSSPAQQNVVNISNLTDGNSRRWVSGTRKIIFQGHPVDSPGLLIDQVFLYDTDTGVTEQLTPSDNNGKTSAFMWKAPEFNNEYVFFTMAALRKQILVYRKLKGADGVFRWTVIKTITAPPALPFFFSPEPFVHNGRSYIFGNVSASSRFFDRSIPTQIAMSGIDPLVSNFRLLTNNSQTPRVRLDPEFFITAKGPFIYYNRLVPATAQFPDGINDGVWRVDTKLGPPLKTTTLR